MLRDQLNNALKEAMKAKEEISVRTLRLIIAALKDRDIATRSSSNPNGINDGEILGMLQSMIKQRHESIEMYKRGKREDLAASELAEINVITNFLPQQMSDPEINDAISEVINKIDATSIKDMGKVMAELKSKHAGKMDFSKASQIVKATLAS